MMDGSQGQPRQQLVKANRTQVWSVDLRRGQGMPAEQMDGEG